MKIAILSDPHDHVCNLEKVIKQIKDKVEMIIHCGDVIAPFSVKIIADANLPTQIVLGNNDEDHVTMYKCGNDKFTWVGVGQQFGVVEVNKRKIAFCHYPKLGKLLAGTGGYDAVFYGHTLN
jgi:putative phosphoesterase